MKTQTMQAFTSQLMPPAANAGPNFYTMASSAGTAVAKGADKATTFVCYYAIYKRLPRVIGLILLWLAVLKMTSGSEDRMDLQGEIVNVEDSVTMEQQTVHTVEASRKVYSAVVIPGSQKENCQTISRKLGDKVVKTQVCTCEKTDLRFVGEDGADQTHSCPSQMGRCSHNNRDAYVTDQGGVKSCSFAKPNVQCRINGSANTQPYPIKCPEKGAQITMIKNIRDGKIYIPSGNWNLITITIKYMDDRGRFRTQKIQKQWPSLAKDTTWKIGSTIPVFYSAKHKRIYLEDWNGAAAAGIASTLFGMIACASLLEALSFLNYYACRLRLGSKLIDAAEDRYGFEI